LEFDHWYSRLRAAEEPVLFPGNSGSSTLGKWVSSLAAVAEMERGMESLISLRYPNGRIHEETLMTTKELLLGGEFDLHGRHWLVIELLRATSTSRNVANNRVTPGRMLCISTRPAALPA
jgi:hypothetical protein